MIKASLVNSFSSETKVEYIKTFDDLETVVKSKVIAIEEAIKGGTDYVSQMIETVKNGEKSSLMYLTMRLRPLQLKLIRYYKQLQIIMSL